MSIDQGFWIEDHDFGSSLKRIGEVRQAIVAEQKATGKWGGILKCPNCTGEVRWSMARSNGHVHAACSTPGCARWME